MASISCDLFLCSIWCEHFARGGGYCAGSLPTLASQAKFDHAVVAPHFGESSGNANPE
jgi:hypothetical protein